ncbi:MAG TPA: PD-(D/E)XK nuclease family protein [Gemmatimonadaceae bacterium]
MPTTHPGPAAPERSLFVADDPAMVADWCRDHAMPGAILVAPSASARRLALRRVVDARGVTLGLAIASRGRLLALLEARAGLTTPRLLPPALERLLVDEAARAARVPLFDDHDIDTPAGAVAAVARLIDTLRRNGITPAQYAAAGGDRTAADAYHAFESRRTALGFEDHAGRVARLVAHGVPSVPLVLQDPTFPDRAAYELYRAAIDAAPSCRIGIAELTPPGAPSPVVARLETLGFSPDRARADATRPAMRAIGGVGMHDEVELVARHMLALLRSRAEVRGDDAGARRALRPDDLLGVAPTARYLQLLGETCVRVGVPVASPRRLEVLDVPLVRALLETFRLLADEAEDTPERGLALLATPYVGLPLREHDQFARALTCRARGAVREWRRYAVSTGRAAFQRFAEAVPVLAARLQSERRPRELAGVLTALALEHGFLSAGRRAHLAAGEDETVRIDQQGWDALVAAMEELNDALRAMQIERLPAGRWLAELVELLAGATVRVDAKPMNGVHLTVAGGGLPSAAHVFAVGWREGLVPRRVREEPLLPDRVKRALNEMGAMFPLAADRAAHDHERRERVVRAARETLTISWPAIDDDGESMLPSVYLDELGVTERTTRGIGDITWPLDLAASRAERVTRAIVLARHRPAASLGDELHAVRATLATLTDDERRAYDGVRHANASISLPPEIRAELASLAATTSASQAKMIAHCLYEHFGTRRLGLAPLTAPRIDPRFLGTVAHRVLRDVGRAGFDPAALPAHLAAQWDAELTTTFGAGADDGHDAGARFEREMLLEQLAALVRMEQERVCDSAGRPAFFELAFGLDDDGRDPASRTEGCVVTLPAGAAIAESTLRGSIDRVDTLVHDGVTYGVAIDYKLGKGDRYLAELKELADFQLPIYCRALRLFDIEPVGAYYLGIFDGERHGVVRADFADAFLLRECKTVTALSPEDFASFMHEREETLVAELARVSRGELEVRPRKDDCGYCDLRPVCRIGTFGVGGQSADA